MTEGEEYKRFMNMEDIKGEYYYIIRNVDTRNYLPLKFEERALAGAVRRMFADYHQQRYEVIRCLIGLGDFVTDDDWVADVIARRVE